MSKHDARIARALENVVMQLRRRNDMTEAFYREVLGVLTEAKKPSRCGVVFGEDVFHGTELRCTLDSGHAGFHDDSNDEGSPVGSGQPAAAPACPVCGNEGYRFGCDPGTAITRTQWLAHHEAYYRDSQEYGASKTNAAYYADRQTEDRFGPCPEES